MLIAELDRQLSAHRDLQLTEKCSSAGHMLATVLAATCCCKLRGRELSPGLLRDRRKY